MNILYKNTYSGNISYYNLNDINNTIYNNAYNNIQENISNIQYRNTNRYNNAYNNNNYYSNSYIISSDIINNISPNKEIIYDSQLNNFNDIINNNYIKSNIYSSYTNIDNNICFPNNSISDNNIYINKNNNYDNNNNENNINLNEINNNSKYTRSKTQNNLQTSSLLRLENEKIEINQAMINLVLSNTIEKYFVLKDFLKLKNERDIITYFYSKEKICFEWLNKNFLYETNQKNFFNNLFLKKIEYIYLNLEKFSNIRKKIKEKINKILEEIEINKNNNLENLYKKYFNLNYLPKFLSKEIETKFENLKFLEKYKKDCEQMKNLYELNQMINYYFRFIKGEYNIFNIANYNEDLFMILLYSNLKDIYKSQKIKKIFLDNYVNIAQFFCYGKIDKIKFNEMIDKNNFNENDTLNLHFYNLKKIQNFQIYLYIITLYFYLIMNIMKDTSDNYNAGSFLNIENIIVDINLNNPIMSRILRNIINNFIKYIPISQLDSNIYQYLINLLNIYIFNEDNKKSGEKNKIYQISDIFYIISKSSLPDIQPLKVQSILLRLTKVESSNLSIFKFLSKIKELFLEVENQESEISKISLSPLNLKRISNIITIFISGFGSEGENIYSWKNFINFESNFSNFYFFKWPSGNFAEMISIIPFSEQFVLEIPQKFINNKLKGKLVGKVLGLFLASNEDFKKCQINLVGFSLGCHVIKYCVKEISKIRGVRNMINNILFMGGATTISDKKNWKNILKNVVGGRIINCYSKHDFVLAKLFKLCVNHTAIGTKPLIIKDENNNCNIIENYDFSDLKLGHLDYRKNFGKILKRINFY